ncbi:MAG: hypothetical protein HY897_13295 [Deltaproteobacteria bacterium]|nr:hypothetical protein [Deltaproteobacteria bacterium]
MIPCLRRSAIGVLIFFALGLPSCAVRAPSPLRELPQETDAVVKKVIDQYGPSGFEGYVSKLLPSSAKLAERFIAAVPEKDRALVSHNPLMDVVAYTFAVAWVQKDAMPADALTTWAFWKLGITSNRGDTRVMWASGGDVDERLDGNLFELAKEFKADGVPREFGIVRINAGNRRAQAVVFGQRHVDVRDLRKFYKPGETLTVKGKILSAFDKPRFYLDRGGHDIVALDVTAGKDGEFTVTAQLPQESGRYFFEISTLDPKTGHADEDSRWRHQILWLPVYVGQDEPSVPDEMIRRPPENPPERQMWAHRILDLYNAERKTLGLKPIGLNVEASDVAADRAAELARNKDLPPDTALYEKMAKRGLLVFKAYQSSGTLQYVDEEAWQNLLSPAHRHSLIDKDVSLAGIGIRQRDEHTYAYIEYAVSPIPKLDAPARKDQLFKELNALRASKGKPEFRRHAEAEAVLDEFVAGVCSGGNRSVDWKPLWAAFEQKGLGRSEAQSISWISRYFKFEKTDEGDASFKELVGSDKTHAAVGVCRGDFEDLPGGEFAAFVLIKPAETVAVGPK